jgi:hypothetical protein
MLKRIVTTVLALLGAAVVATSARKVIQHKQLGS